MVSAPIVFLGGFEGVLRLAGFGVATELFIPDGKPGYYRTNPNFTAPFMPSSFGIRPLNFRIQKKKEANSIRVFVLGESAAQGIPDPDFGMAAQLRAQLRARFPAKTVEVCNLGITAIDSHVVYRVASQSVAFEPDLLVIYMGNNEVVGPYGPGCSYSSYTPPLWAIRAGTLVRSTRTGQLLQNVLGRFVHAGVKSQDWKGMETFSDSAVRGDDPRLETMYRNFSANLHDIVGVARDAGIRVVLSTVVANLRDSAPFISEHRAGMSAADLAAWKTAEGDAIVAWNLGDPTSAAAELEGAASIDPEFAETHFRLGSLAESLGDTALARKHYLDALHWDALRFRPETRLNEIIRQVGRQSGAQVTLVDAALAMGSDPDSRGPLAGRSILFDHVHFNWHGNYQLCLLLSNASADALFGANAPAASALDSDACARALGYTPEATLKMLQTMVQLTLRPPFTNQITFTEDQASLKKEVEATTFSLNATGARSADIESLQSALALDADNAAIALRLGRMESETGDAEHALALIDKAEELLPPSPDVELTKGEALLKGKRYPEAETALTESLSMDQVYFSAARPLVELWSTTGQFERGKGLLEQLLERAPSNHYLRLEYASLLARNAHPFDAEKQARQIWDDDPNSRPAMAALEMLVLLYGRDGRADTADAITLEARTHQPADYYNNQRLVRIYAARNDASGVADGLKAMAGSGPFDSAAHLDLAHRLADLNRGPEMLDELAAARAVAQIEGDAARMQEIDGRIAAFRQRFSPGRAQ
jgi:tetratricopeptide (TPR) repeat protein